MNKNQEITRRDLLLGGLGIFGSLVAAGCGGGGGGITSPPTSIDVTATVDGSVYENTALIYLVGEEFDEDYNDWKVTRIGPEHAPLLISSQLVFEVNGQWRVGSSDSARRTNVRAGDVITWKLT